MFKKTIFLLLAITAVFTAGCSDDEGTGTILVERFQNGRYPVSSFTGIRDVFLYEGTPGTNTDNSGFLSIAPATNARSRTLFDADLRGYLPETVTLHKVTLTLFRASSSGKQTIVAHALDTSWSETAATWNTSGSSAWQGGPISGAEIGRRTDNGTDESFSIDLDLTAARKWFTTTEFSHGIILRADNENVMTGYASFRDSEYATDYLRPLLTVYYTVD